MTERTHLDLDEWRAFFEHTAGDGDRETMLDHIASCPQCAQVFKSARSAGLAALGAPRPRPTGHRVRVLVPIAATLAIVIVSAIVMSRRTTPPAAPVATTAAPPAARPQSAKPPIVISAEELLSARGSKDANTKYLESLAEALRPYDQDDFATAIARLEPLASAHPDRFEPVFYLGASLMMAGRAAEALPVLERAVTLAGPARRPQAEATLADARRSARP